MGTLSRREHRSSVIWPGFVDALATLLMVIIFLLMIFVLAQFFLGQALSGREQAIRQLESDLSELARVLALSRAENEQLVQAADGLRQQLSASVAARAGLEAELAQLRADYAASQDDLARAQASFQASQQALNEARLDIMAQQSANADLRAARALDQETIDRQRAELADLSGDIAALRALKEELEREVTELSFRAQGAETRAADLEDRLDELRSENESLQVGLQEREEIADSARAQVALLNQQIAALRQQLNALNQALEAAEADAEAKNVQIEALGQRLNAALASRVQELSRYRSEFFGRLRELIGNRRDVRIVGDRFVLQSELLFAKGSADLGDGGKTELETLATTLLEIAIEIPGDLDWILRVDGHTDSDPISTAQFPSNWELSTARALSVVHFLEDVGIPSRRMAATGFGEHYPIVEGNSEQAKARNRRIEFKFTQR